MWMGRVNFTLFYLPWFAVPWHQWLRTNWSNCPQTDGRFPKKRIFSVCRQFLQFCKACQASFKAEIIHLCNSPWWLQGKPQRYCKKEVEERKYVWKGGKIVVVCRWKDNRNLLKWSQYPTKVGSSPPSPILYVIIIIACQEQIGQIKYSHTTSDWESVFKWYKKTGVHFVHIFLHSSFYLTKQQYPGCLNIPHLEDRTIAVKSLIGHYNPVALELRKYENHFPKLIRAGEKKVQSAIRIRTTEKQDTGVKDVMLCLHYVLLPAFQNIKMYLTSTNGCCKVKIKFKEYLEIVLSKKNRKFSLQM